MMGPRRLLRRLSLSPSARRDATRGLVLAACLVALAALAGSIAAQRFLAWDAREHSIFMNGEI